MDGIDEVSSTTKDDNDLKMSTSSTGQEPNAQADGVIVESMESESESSESAPAKPKKRKSSNDTETDAKTDEQDNDPSTIDGNEVVANATSPEPEPSNSCTMMDVDADAGQGNTEAVGAQQPKEAEKASEVKVPIKEPDPELPPVELRVVYNKETIPVRISLKKTVGDLKRVVEKSTGVAPELQKILVRGMPKDDVVLETLGLSNGSKVLVVGTKLDDVIAIAKPPTASELAETSSSSVAGSTDNNSNWCSLPRHQKIIEKGIPEDVMPGILDVRDPLPDIPLFGMVSSKGSKLRLTFKLEADEIWIATKERTDKVPISSIRNVTSQPITGYEHYHILAIQMGPTEASRVYIYWVPAQYIKAIKDALSS